MILRNLPLKIKNIGVRFLRSIIIYASKSLTIRKKHCNSIKEDPLAFDNDSIVVGNNRYNNYVSYLYFDTSPIPDGIENLTAELVLFKLSDFSYKDICFAVCPLVDYFSSITTSENPPGVDMSSKLEFNPFTNKVALEIDLSDIVNKWANNSLINKGIVLSGNNVRKAVARFGSAFINDVTLVPFLRVSFEEVEQTIHCIKLSKPISVDTEDVQAKIVNPPYNEDTV